MAAGARNLPDSSAYPPGAPVAKGDRVLVHSLIKGAHLNGCVGFVQSNGGQQGHEGGGGGGGEDRVAVEIVLPAGAPYACEETSRTLGKLRRENIERFDPPCLLDEVVGVVPQPSDGLDPTRYFSVGHSCFPCDVASILLERIAVEKETATAATPQKEPSATGGVSASWDADLRERGLGMLWMTLALPGMQDGDGGGGSGAKDQPAGAQPRAAPSRGRPRASSESASKVGGLMERAAAG